MHFGYCYDVFMSTCKLNNTYSDNFKLADNFGFFLIKEILIFCKLFDF